MTTDFSADALPAEVNPDIPNGALAAITLDTANDELDFTTTGNTDMWGGRANAPIAWTSRPSVSLGQTWYEETFVRFNGASDGAQRVAGITLWSGPNGTGGQLRLYNNNRSFSSTSGRAGSPGEIRDDLEGRRIMDEIQYRDVAPWPVGSDGSGSTLAKRDPATGTPHQANWSVSMQPNGTPGFINAAALKPSIAINEITATTDAPFRLELFNYGTAAVSLDGMVIASSDPANADYVLPVGSLAPGAFLSIDATTLGFSPTDNNRLFLFGIGKVALIDAVRADDRAKARSSNGTGRWLRPDVASFGATNSFAITDDIVINEIFYHPYPQRVPFAERDEEWLELYNSGASPVDLTGWKLEGGIDYDFPVATRIPAGGYLVIAKHAAALSTKHPEATVIGDFSKSLGNGGDLIVLEDPSGNPVDEVHYYDSGKWHAHADGGGSSLELLDPKSNNRFAGAWTASDETSRSSWQAYTYEGVAENDGLGNNVYHEFLLGMLEAGELLLDDVSVIENPGRAAIEFIQNGDFEGDTPGADKWRAVGTHGSHGKTVVITDPDDPGNQCLHLVATAQTEDKHNKLETTFAGGQTIVPGNTYRITFRAKWLGGSNLVNTRLYFNYLQRTTAIEVPDVWGTPGLANSTAVANAGPVLTGLTHTPAIPDANEAVTVSIDSDGLNDLTLFYSVNAGPYQRVTMSAAGGGGYSGIIPGQSSSRVVRFYVRSRDHLNATSFLPAAATDGGAFSVPNSTVVLEGDAWIDVFEIHVNGVPLPVTWTDRDLWQINAPIGIGANPLTIAGYNIRGTEVANDTITVTNTSSTGIPRTLR